MQINIIDLAKHVNIMQTLSANLPGVSECPFTVSIKLSYRLLSFKLTALS